MWGQGHFSKESVAESVSSSGIVQMDEDTHYNKVEDVVGSHVEDAVTFWAQNINRNKEIMTIGCSLSKVCPLANSVFGNLDPKKGRTFLGSLIFEKEIKMRIKATYQDGTVIAQAEYGSVNIGEEVAKKGFAEKWKLTSTTNVCEEKKLEPGQFALRNLKSPIPLWGHRSNQSTFSRPKGRLSGRLALDLKNENDAGNHMTFPKESLAVGDFNLGSNVSLAKIKQDQKLIEENEKLKTEKDALFESYKALELKVEQTLQELQQEKAAAVDLTKHLESTLKTRVGTRMKNLAAKVELLKEIRRASINVRFGNDLSDAIQVLDEGCFTTPPSLNELEIIWAQYNQAQEKIQTCQNVSEGNILVAQRNEVQQKLYMAVEVFILDVDELPLNKRLKTLQSDDHDGSEIEKIKQEITELRNSVFQEIYHEREEYEHGDADKEIILNMYSQVLQKIRSEEKLIATVQSKYKDSIENSGGLFTMSLERDLLDAEPMKELSSKRPLVCSEVNGQIILLKGYSVDVDTEARAIQRAATYHRAWREAKEESGLLPLIFLFLCKSDPMAYLMVPYYPRANLSAIQASMPLTSAEALKVMKGVAQGLHTLHKADIIHGSLHQNNVFALNREQGIVGDFDFTKSVSQRASVNMVVGDLSLISPELKMGKPASPSSDLYAYGCLLLWLSVQNQEFETNEDGIPKVDQFHLDDNVKSLLCSLIYSRSSMTAEQVLNAECFLIPKGKSIPNPEKDIEYTQYREKEELKLENLDKYEEKTRNGEANFD
ncbi:PREDICTED: serine/threonine-protein kinase 31 [Propithecus coquereli]|uniref:serine/threonine-protein kinase 31 n=1 Tax=Propithecus coquereli TaxID=379532 RepID=UPI00063FA9EC|nr:PREDICTED: serine/threonine-protein kinase 31 [Propithecus coquereli]